MVKHIVLWQFQDDATADEAVAHLQPMFAEFCARVPGLTSYELHRGFAGFSACLITTHQDRAALQAYQDHPEHTPIRSYIHPRITNRASCDFEL